MVYPNLQCRLLANLTLKKWMMATLQITHQHTPASSQPAAINHDDKTHTDHDMNKMKSDHDAGDMMTTVTGAQVTFYHFSDGLKTISDSTPKSFHIYLRLRPGKQEHGLISCLFFRNGQAKISGRIFDCWNRSIFLSIHLPNHFL